MSGCPQPEDLLDLLDPRSPPGGPLHGLRAHAAACPACAAQLRALRQAFGAMGPADGPLAAVPMDPSTLRRIEDHVMAAVAATAPTQSRSAGLWARGALAALSVLGALCAWWLLVGHPLTSPPGMLLAAAPLLLTSALGATRRVQRVALGLGLMGISAALLSATAGLWVPFMRGAGCLALLASGVAGPALVLRGAARGEDDGALRGALLGAALFSGGATLQRSLCDLGGAAHVLCFHLLPFFIGVTALALLGRKGPTNHSRAAA